MFEKNNKGVAAGAVLGSLLGTLSAFLSTHPQQALEKGHAWIDKAKELGKTVIKEVKHFRASDSDEEHATPPFVAGALMGLLLGAGAALLIAPNTGKQLRTKLTKQYGEIVDKAQDLLGHVNNKATVGAVKKKAAAALPKVQPKKKVTRKAPSRAKKKA